ncbi:MAG: Na/Pi cotransporter family protein [Hyphomicrobiales bacterium]
METFSIVAQILTLIGSLGFFLYGMKLMSESLQKVAGSKMRNILAAMTSNRLKGVFTGFLVTTVIQSSSATTVMLVSFVNAGLLSLIQSIGVIMGANIGTTVTAWIISILGFKVKMNLIALPLVGISFPLLFSKISRKKAWGELIIGFSILFIGLDFLKDAIPNVADSPQIFQFLEQYTDLGYLSVILFVGLGTILTVVIQSSSATMALTLVMCNSGWIPFEMAAAMVLGENIGTTITANMAAMVANTSAKRAARAHLLFNLFGVIWMLIIFYPFLNLIDWFIQDTEGVSSIMANKPTVAAIAAIPIALASFHTAFNIINTFGMLWFARTIAKVATYLVKSKEDDDEQFRLQYIRVGLLSTSELSIVQARKEIAFLAKRTSKMFELIPKLLVEKNEKKYNKLLKKAKNYEDIIDRMEVEIANYLTKISESKISRRGTMQIRAMLKIIDDIESIGDVCYNMIMTIKSKNEQKLYFTQDLRDNLDEMFLLTKEALLNMEGNLNLEYKDVLLSKASDIEAKINELRDNLRVQHVEDIKQEKYSYKKGTFYSSLFSNCEKVGDHVINVSEAIVENQP